MRWWVGASFLIAASVLAAASPKTIVSAQVTPELRASLGADATLDVVVTPHQGDAWSRLARRVTGDAERWHALAELNGAGGNLTPEMRVRVPFALLRPELQRQVATTLFRDDGASANGWRHIVIGGGQASAPAVGVVEGESLWNIAEWFTGDGANYTAVRKANPTQGLSTRKGDVILIPWELLTAAFRSEVPRVVTEETNAPKTAEVRKTEDDPGTSGAPPNRTPSIGCKKGRRSTRRWPSASPAVSTRRTSATSWSGW